jgi:hypothetical protein
MLSSTCYLLPSEYKNGRTAPPFPPLDIEAEANAPRPYDRSATHLFAR